MSKSRFQPQVLKIFTEDDSQIAQNYMPTRAREALRDFARGLELGKLPTHGAMLGARMVERCPGSQRYAEVEEEKGGCAICGVEFPIFKTYSRRTRLG